MDLSLFQRLTVSELDQYLNDIDLALEYHHRWLAAVNRALACRRTEDIDHFRQDLLHQCYFGRWYASIEEPDLLNEPAYLTIGKVHDQLHRQVRQVMETVGRGEPLPSEDYNTLTSVNTAFRQVVGELKAAIKHDLKLIATLMGKVFENAEEGVIITDREAKILHVNPAFTRVTGYRREDVLGKNPNILHSGKQDQAFYENFWRELLRNNRWQGQIWNRRKDGNIYPEWLNISAVMGEAGEVSHYVAIFSDIASQKDSEERLYYLAHYDHLSKLPNRLAFRDRLRHAIQHAKRNHNEVAVMFLDLDGFKQVNDTLGHTAGDEVIREVAIRLGSAMRETDTIARFGGDEFTILLSEVGAREGVEIAAQKIIDAVSEPIRIDDSKALVTTSIGISLYPKDGDDIETLIRQADMAMYAAKESGKNTYLFYDKAKL